MKKFISVIAGILLMTATAYGAECSPWAEETIENVDRGRRSVNIRPAETCGLTLSKGR